MNNIHRVNIIHPNSLAKIMANIPKELVPLILEVIKIHNNTEQYSDELIEKMNQASIFIGNRSLIDPITEDYISPVVVLEVKDTIFRIRGHAITKEVII